MDQKSTFRSGFIAIIGRPNVGKSTLLNGLLGEKLAIVSDKPQTTRNRIMGIITGKEYQAVFLDTPGIHQPHNRLGEYMMQTVRDSLQGIDALVLVVDASKAGDMEHKLAEEMSKQPVYKILVLNKIDLVPKAKLLSVIQSFSQAAYDEIVPISALTGDGTELLKSVLVKALPEGPRYFPDDALTDQPERFICAEMIREKALHLLKDEVPHGIGIEVLGVERVSEKLTEINATIYCERASHKGIIIGRQGTMLRQIGSEARQDIEKLLNTHVHLQLWVKVRPNWRNQPADLKTLGYTDRE
ncbi:MAG TPA: GTPase Era [Candidatus Limiplasma sp.]|nr:GTPase Era [Candidatus Limiplasma sp.]HRX09213.1 GTPase Era [Candidatus Limiplasma sp.]